jgi:hypothetical protein
MKIETRPCGTVLNPSLHDGYLTSIEYLPENQIALRGQSVEGDKCCYLLSGVDEFRADGLLERNIILDITIRSGHEVREEELIDALKCQGSPLKFRQVQLEKIRACELVLFQLNPSYGASVGCTCRQVELAE